MNSVEKKKFSVNVDLWRWVAIISGIFAFLMCFLVIANYIQINRLDPVNTEAINTLVVRLSENPSDEALRNEIRALDLLVRKAYFTNQWQVRSGGYILLISLALMLIAFQIIKSAKSLDPHIDDSNKESDQLLKKISRKWIAIGGAAIIVIAFVLTFLTHEKLETKFSNAAIAADNEDTNDSEDKTIKKISASTEVLEKKEEKTQNNDPIKEEVKQAPSEEKVIEKAVETPLTKTVEETKVLTVDVPDFITEARNNFPSFRGSEGMGISYQKNVPTIWDGASNQNILWKVKIALPGYNSPIVWGDKLFVTGANSSAKEVYCYNKNTGDLIWTTSVKDIPGSPAKAPKVTEDTGMAAPTAATDGKNVYAIFADGDIIAIDMDGNQVWAKNLGVPQNHYAHSSSLFVYGDKLIIQYDHGKSAKVMALATATGDEIWSTSRKVRISWASPVIAHRGNHTEVILIADPSIAGYDINTGAELWSIKCIYGEVGPSIAYADGIVFGLNEYASLVAISGGNDPVVLWEDFDYLSDVPSPIATKDYLIVVTSYGVVICHNAKTGEKYWEKEFDNGFYASPVIVDDIVYLMDREGIMHMFKLAKEYEMIAESALGERVDTCPAFADGQVFIRAEDHLFCIGTGN